jgi:hypothetical protein
VTGDGLAACSATKTVQVDRETIRLQAALLNTTLVTAKRCLGIRVELVFRLMA